MNRNKQTFPFKQEELKITKQKMLNWASRFGIFLFLDSNEYTAQGGTYECLLAADAKEIVSLEDDSMFGSLHQFQNERKDWLFGHISYEAKNVLEPRLSSRNEARHAFPVLQFFVPNVVMGIRTGTNTLFIETSGAAPTVIYEEMMSAPVNMEPLPGLSFRQRVSQADYLPKIAALREHIRNGDCYEINFCTEGFCEAAAIDAISVFHHLNRASPAPFAACYKLHNQYLMCASPERYLRKEESTIIAQPIKGTARRGTNVQDDEQLRKNLQESEKERAENVMIVDLMRNDLARSCVPGSVAVNELFGIYTFPQVHQMISTVSGRLAADKTWADVLENSFPMGSMTGAPKVKVMELIDKYETAKRELFSGTVGYVSPDGDFDFNVVIRSLFYNAASGYLSYQTGGAITWDSDAQSEWEELRLKAAAMERLFSGPAVL